VIHLILNQHNLVCPLLSEVLDQNNPKQAKESEDSYIGSSGADSDDHAPHNYLASLFVISR